MNVLHKAVVLKLNKFFMPLRPEIPQKIFVDMAKDTVRGLNIEYTQNSDGSINFDEVTNIEAVTWDKWLALPVREYDLYVRTARGKVRVPSVVVCSEYGKVPRKNVRLTKENVARRDGWVCQYTLQPLTKKEATIDHIIPSSLGGKTIWENVVLCSKQINSMKGNRLNHEVGLKLHKKPVAPPSVPATVAISREKILNRDWVHFLFK